MPDLQPQPEGIELNTDMLIQTQNNYISQAALKAVQMETAIAQLQMENVTLREQLAEYDGAETTEVKEA